MTKGLRERESHTLSYQCSIGEITIELEIAEIDQPKPQLAQRS